MNNSEKFFEEVYDTARNLYLLQEETGRRFIQDAKNQLPEIESMSDVELWNWVTARVDSELRNNIVLTHGYLEGKLWHEFFEAFEKELKKLIPGKKRKYFRKLFNFYKCALWGTEAIKDNNLKWLKLVVNDTEDKQLSITNHNRPNNYRPIKNNHISATLSNWTELRKQQMKQY